MVTKLEIENLKPGDFIKASFRYGNRCGIVEKIKKEIVVIKNCTQFYNKFTLTNELVNITKKRITEIGLKENEFISK